jgi:hypothetical protein
LLVADASSVHGESFGASPSFDIPPLAGDEVQDKSVQDESVTIFINVTDIESTTLNFSPSIPSRTLPLLDSILCFYYFFKSNHLRGLLTYTPPLIFYK